MSDVKWTDKGLYHHPQPAGFVSLKQYMIIESDKKKCLLLRFLNELPLLVSAMEFKLTQLDSSGNVLDSTNVRVDSMSTPQNCTFALRTGIVLHKDCMDFTVTVLNFALNKLLYFIDKLTSFLLLLVGNIAQIGRSDDRAK